MALKDVLKSPPRTSGGPRSRIEVWREKLDDADRKAFDAAVRNPEWQSAALVRALKPEGLETTGNSMSYYRRKVTGE